MIDENDLEVSGVRLSDVFRDQDGELWEVVGLTTEPTAIVRNATSREQQRHVIGCLSWQSKWQSGPLRAIASGGPEPKAGQ